MYDPGTTLKFGYRRDYFHTLAGEPRDFFASTIFPTSNGSLADIANSGFVRLEKEVFAGGMAFVALANGERPASNIECASVAGFDLKKEKNREANIGLTVTQPRWKDPLPRFLAASTTTY